MSEYVRKKALLDSMNEQEKVYRGYGLHPQADTVKWWIAEIESGRFDADQTEIQRLRAAAIKLHETLNTYWQGDCDKSAVVNAQSNLCDILSTTTEPINAEKVERVREGDGNDA